jgi:porin
MRFNCAVFWRSVALAAFAAWPFVRAEDAPSPAAAATPQAPVGIWDQPYLLDDAGGWRTKLNAAGWQPFATWSAELWDNARGGIRDGTTDDMLLNAGTEADLQKLAGWDGGTFRISFDLAQSTHPDHNTGELNSPSSIDAADQIRVFELFLRQKLCDDQLTLKIGQIGADADFAQTPGTDLFLNAGLTGQPVMFSQTLANGDPAGPQFPMDAPGIFARLDPKGCPVYTQLGLYLADAGVDTSNNHGFDWHTGNGVLLAGETGGNYHVAQLPGMVAAGAFYMNGQFTNADSGAPQRGIYGVYGFINQTLLQTAGAKGADPSPVLAGYLFGGGAGPDERVGPDCNFGGGVDWYGPLPSRPQDTAGAALLYTGFSPAFTRSAFNPNGPGVTPAGETVLEFTCYEG